MCICVYSIKKRTNTIKLFCSVEFLRVTNHLVSTLQTLKTQFEREKEEKERKEKLTEGVHTPRLKQV